MSEEKVRFRGTPIYMDGRTWIVPPISVRQMQEYEAEDHSKASVESSLSLIHKAMTRNYPDVTVEWLRESLDAASTREAVAALSASSGLVLVAPGE